MMRAAAAETSRLFSGASSPRRCHIDVVTGTARTLRLSTTGTTGTTGTIPSAPRPLTPRGPHPCSGNNRYRFTSCRSGTAAAARGRGRDQKPPPPPRRTPPPPRQLAAPRHRNRNQNQNQNRNQNRNQNQNRNPRHLQSLNRTRKNQFKLYPARTKKTCATHSELWIEN